MPKQATSFIGKVTSAGVTPKVATFRTRIQKYDKKLRRHYTQPLVLHISDPTQALHTHDVVRVAYSPYLSRSHNVTHTVTEIVAPWGRPLSARPALLTDEERAARRALQILDRGGERARRLRDGEVVVDGAGRVQAVPSAAAVEAAAAGRAKAARSAGLGWRRFAGRVAAVTEEGEERAELADLVAEEKQGKGAAAKEAVDGEEVRRLVVEKAPEVEREKEEKRKMQKLGQISYVDKQGNRRVVQSEVMKKVEKMRQEANKQFDKMDKAQEKASKKGINIEKRMEGLNVTGGEMAAAQI